MALILEVKFACISEILFYCVSEHTVCGLAPDEFFLDFKKANLSISKMIIAMKSLKDFLRFERLVAPTVLRILFWPAAAASIYYSVLLIVTGNPIGWIPLIVGTLFVRVVFEGMILFFSINEKLSKIYGNLDKS